MLSNLLSSAMIQTHLQTFPPFINLEREWNIWPKFSHFLQLSHKVKVSTFSLSKFLDFQFQTEKMILFYSKPLKSGKLYSVLLNLGSNKIAWGRWGGLFKELNLPQNTGHIFFMWRETPILVCLLTPTKIYMKCVLPYPMTSSLSPQEGTPQLSRECAQEQVVLPLLYSCSLEIYVRKC